MARPAALVKYVYNLYILKGMIPEKPATARRSLCRPPAKPTALAVALAVEVRRRADGGRRRYRERADFLGFGNNATRTPRIPRLQIAGRHSAGPSPGVSVAAPPRISAVAS